MAPRPETGSSTRWTTVVLAAVLYAAVGLTTLLLARYTGRPKAGAADRLQALLTEFGLTQSLASRYP